VDSVELPDHEVHLGFSLGEFPEFVVLVADADGARLDRRGVLDRLPEAPVSLILDQPSKTDEGAEQQILGPPEPIDGAHHRPNHFEGLAAERTPAAEGQLEALRDRLELLDDLNFGLGNVELAAAGGTGHHDAGAERAQRDRRAAHQAINRLRRQMGLVDHGRGPNRSNHRGAASW
jgi:hypothetical protein